MITTLTRSVRRRDPRTGIVVRLAPEGLFVREPGRRTEYGPISFGSLLLQGARAKVEADRAAKRQRHLERRAMRAWRP
jgi:hypothetical protein